MDYQSNHWLAKLELFNNFNMKGPLILSALHIRDG